MSNMVVVPPSRRMSGPVRRDGVSSFESDILFGRPRASAVAVIVGGSSVAFANALYQPVVASGTSTSFPDFTS